jgi:hypothetical protein
MFNNCNKKMFFLANSSMDKYGLDQTGKIIYKFDSYGFREGNNYNIDPSIVFFGCSYLTGTGVNINQRFSSYFNNSWNFGLFGEYKEEELLVNYELFKKNYKDYNTRKIVFCWKSKNSFQLKKLITSVDNNKNIYHTVPSNIKLKNYKLLRNLENVDYDISGTHYGPLTHQKFSKLLWYFLK